jgi:O-antigen/teichoic acid export membrane protein
VKPNQSLGASARASLGWAGGFMLLRDVLRFVTMLVLVRLLQPSDYGTVALAESIVALLSVVSFNTFVSHALQARDPVDIDWQAHFTAGAVVNTLLALVTLVVAWGLTFSDLYAAAAGPLAVLSLVFVVEIPAALRQRMLQVTHEWRRFRSLIFIGSLLSSFVGIMVALFGGGFWALAVQPVVLGFPAMLDLFTFAKWRPRISWSWTRYRATAGFGAMRMIAGLLRNGHQTFEQSMVAGTYQFAALGIFTRAVGLGTLIAGRLGIVAVDSLYPVITRAERRSARFKRYAGLIMRGVCWTTIPSSVLLALFAPDIVTLLYGTKWNDVIPLLPLAAIAVGFGSMAMAAQTLLLANSEIRACLAVDATSAILGVGLALALVPMGLQIYLGALVVHGVVLLAISSQMLLRTGGIDRTNLLKAFLPPLLAVATASGAVVAVRVTVGSSTVMPLRLCSEAALFTVAYLGVLRLVFARALHELVEAAPASKLLTGLLALPSSATSRS